MRLVLATNYDINVTRLHKVLEAESREKAIPHGVLSKLSDLVSGHKKTEALELFFDLTHPEQTAPAHDMASAVDMMTTFTHFREMIGPAYRDDITATIEQQDDHYVFDYHIRADDGGTLFTYKYAYGKPENEIHSLQATPLNNSSEYLPTAAVQQLGVEGALAKVSYQPDNAYPDGYLQGVTEHNQGRLGLNLLSPQARTAMQQNPELAQQWVKDQMKLIDFDFGIAQKLQPITDQLADMDRPEDSWQRTAAQSMTQIRQNITNQLAQQLNQHYIP